jgi:hypothetical protein
VTRRWPLVLVLLEGCRPGARPQRLGAPGPRSARGWTGSCSW